MIKNQQKQYGIIFIRSEISLFSLQKKGNLEYYTIDMFERTGLVNNCFSTKRGGVSKGIYESMNLRINSEDSKDNILKNFDILCSAIGIDYKNIVCSNQIHEDKIITVGKGDIGNGLFYENKFESADGLITDEPGVALATFYADCVPLYFLDTKKKIIALVHSGWKGTVQRIGQKAVEKFKKDYSSNVEDIIAAIGPSIGECHFEVGEDVAQKFTDEFGSGVVSMYGEKPHVNLQKAVRMQLEEAGIKNITDSGICTYCNSDLLFSHRKTLGKRGNLAAIMQLK